MRLSSNFSFENNCPFIISRLDFDDTRRIHLIHLAAYEIMMPNVDAAAAGNAANENQTYNLLSILFFGLVRLPCGIRPISFRKQIIAGSNREVV